MVSESHQGHTNLPPDLRSNFAAPQQGDRNRLTPQTGRLNRPMIHIARDGFNLGVFTREDVQLKLSSGEILRSDDAWIEGMLEWKPLHELVSIDGPPIPPPKRKPLSDASDTQVILTGTKSHGLLQQRIPNWFLLPILGILALVFLGNYHFVNGSKNGPTILKRDAFGFGEMFINVDEITGMPWFSAKTRFPIGCRVLAREGIIESDEKFRERTTEESKRKFEAAMLEAKNDLGKILGTTQTDQNILGSKEVELFSETLAKAKSGDVASQSSVAVMYANGQGVVKDEAEARKWMRKAAEQNDSRSQRNLYLIYSQGDLGVSKDQTEAMKWLMKAVEQNEAQAQYFLGAELLKGKNMPTDIAQAYAWVKIALLNGIHSDDREKLAKSTLALIEEKITSAEKQAAIGFLDKFRATKLDTKAKVPVESTVKIGDKVEFSDSEWVVEEAHDLGRVLRGNEFTEPKHTTGKFVKVQFHIVNTTNKEEQILETPKLVDTKGRKFNQMADTALYLPDGTEELTLEQLPAGVAKTFFAIYEVAEDAKGLAFEAHSLGFNPRHVLVTLDF